MTIEKRLKRTPTLLLSLATVSVAAVALSLSLTGGSDAATAGHLTQHPLVAKPAKHPEPAVRSAPVEHARPTDARSGDAAGQMYLTDTDERDALLIHRWFSCLLDHGATPDTGAQAAPYQGRGRHVLTVADPIPDSARTACADKEPLLPKEENPSLNPDYAADSEANVQCIRDHGVAVHTVSDTSVFPDGLSWTYDNDHVITPDNEAQLEKACLIKAFSH